MSNEDNNDGILSRWSKRKRSVNDLEEENADAGTAQEHNEDEIEERELELAANRQAAEEIDIDTIDEESDLSLFMKEGVPEALKKAALAKLWRSNPIFANIDGLVDYDDNFADPNLIMKTFTSAYQIGKGYLKEVLEEDNEETNSEQEVAEEIVEKEETTSTAEIVEDDELEEMPEIETTELHDNTEEFEPVEVAKVPLRSRLGLLDEG